MQWLVGSHRQVHTPMRGACGRGDSFGTFLEQLFPPELQPSLLRLTSDTPSSKKPSSDSPLWAAPS